MAAWVKDGNSASRADRRTITFSQKERAFPRNRLTRHVRCFSKCMAEVLRILAVDDEPSITQCMRFIFEQPEYEITLAQDGEDALHQMANLEKPFHVIITDNNMPGGSGVEFVRKLRQLHFAGKVMVLSAHLSEELRAAYEELGADSMVDKPFNIDYLRNALAELAA